MKTLFKRAVLCPLCGKRAKKNTYNHTIGFGQVGGSKEPYKGNMKVIKNKYQYFKIDPSLNTNTDDYEVSKDGKKRKLTSQVIWDGETYYHNYGNFCSTGCAIQYANIIVDRSGLNNSNKVKRGEY
jgi:hypothetical protein